MSTPEFIASLVSSLAWPAVVVVLLLTFRSTITGLLARQVSRLKAGPVELEWERASVEVQGAVQPAPELLHRGFGPDVVNDLYDLALQSPAGAVLEGYARVEQALRQRVGGGELAEEIESGLAAERPVPETAHTLARRAEDLELVTSETVRAVDGITVLRNLAAHRPSEVTTDQALEYLGLVEAILYTVSTWLKPDNPDA